MAHVLHIDTQNQDPNGDCVENVLAHKTLLDLPPRQLMYTLECGEYDHLVEWSFNGRSFVVKNTDEFSATVLPALFKEAKFDSFARKMRRWGFSTKRRPTGSGWLFQHPLFQRDNYTLSSQMSCTNRRFDISPQEAAQIRQMDPAQQLVSSQSRDPYSFIAATGLSGGDGATRRSAEAMMLGAQQERQQQLPSLSVPSGRYPFISSITRSSTVPNAANPHTNTRNGASEQQTIPGRQNPAFLSNILTSSSNHALDNSSVADYLLSRSSLRRRGDDAFNTGSTSASIDTSSWRQHVCSSSNIGAADRGDDLQYQYTQELLGRINHNNTVGGVGRYPSGEGHNPFLSRRQGSLPPTMGMLPFQLAGVRSDERIGNIVGNDVSSRLNQRTHFNLLARNGPETVPSWQGQQHQQQQDIFPARNSLLVLPPSRDNYSIAALHTNILRREQMGENIRNLRMRNENLEVMLVEARLNLQSAGATRNINNFSTDDEV